VLQWLGKAAIWIGLCVLPIGLIVGIPLFFGGRGLNRIRKRIMPKKAKKSTEKAIVEIPEEE
jgi:hypothetical protein